MGSDEFSVEEEEVSSRRSNTRQSILNAAKELVARKGPNATTVRDITAASGANGAAVNYYFQSKDSLVRLANQEITADVNRERLALLEAMEREAQGGPLAGRQILRALIEPILTVSRSDDGGSLYVRNVFQMRVDARAGQNSFGMNGHVARRFVDVILISFPTLSREDAIWQYEFARGTAIHMLANLDPLSRRFEQLALEPGEVLPQEPQYQLREADVSRVIDLLLNGFGVK